ncbi:MAG TPA: AsmA-like C-terminal region-containing protein [Vicinamibacterales bacterium]|nr:AsmA-like C-terminal region-containing protein [Vicinamibacterales bacterium]
MTRGRRLVLWIAGSGVAIALALLATTAWMLRPEWIRPRVTAALSERLNLETTLDEVSIVLWPRPRISGSGLRMRVPGRPDLPPFIAIDHFWVDAGPFTIWKRRVGTVHLDGLKIAVPPSEARPDLPGTQPPPAPGTGSKVVVEHLVTHDAELKFIPRRPDKLPLTFKIHELKLDDLGFDRAIPFYAKLTNPVPTGLVETRGTFGPWRRDDPAETPVAGEYTLTNADLSTINGIGGILQSSGKYEGKLTQVITVGEAQTKDFSLDLGGKPVPLETRFHTIVDGTDGSTRLERVDAKLRNTSFSTWGTIANLSGPGRHAIDLEFDIKDGRIEDLLALSIDSPQPLLTGNVSVRGTLSLPPGPSKVRRRLLVSGTFALARGQFTDSKVQDKLRELSRRSQGKGQDEDPGRVLTSMKGRFALRNGALVLPDLTFHVPGAAVNLAGQYQIDGEVIDFRGTLKMQASVSKAVGGFKSIFLKPFDPLFREKGAGAVVPIKITGTRKEPKMGIEMGKVFR